MPIDVSFLKFFQNLLALFYLIAFAIDFFTWLNIAHLLSISIEQFENDISPSYNIKMILILASLVILFISLSFITLCASCEKSTVLDTFCRRFKPNENSMRIYLPILALIVVFREALVYNYLSSFNLTRNYLYVGRCLFAIIYSILIFMTFMAHLIYSKSTQTDTNRYSYKPLEVILALFVGTLLMIIIIMNTITIVQLKSASNVKEGIKIGYFNDIEIEQLLNETTSTRLKLDQRFVGNLKDVIESLNKIQITSTCSKNNNKRGHVSCKDRHFYRYEIPCTNQTRHLYKDCDGYKNETFNVKSLRLLFTYLDDGDYPTFNCMLKTDENECAPKCLLHNSHFILIQQTLSGDLEPAWKGLSRDNFQPKIKLERDLSLNVCHETYLGRLFNSNYHKDDTGNK
jgi:hypothetical protein